MRSHLKFLLFITLFASSSGFGQEDDDTTVFITSTEKLKTTKDKYTDGHFFTQYALTFSIIANPESGEYNEVTQEDEPVFTTDGIGAYASIGVHYHKWIGFTVNTGLDYKIQRDLLSFPAYGSAISYLHFGEDSGFYLEGGYGLALPINQTLKMGDYQKYKLGIIIEERISFYIDYSVLDYPDSPQNNIRSLGIGFSLINFW